MSGILERRGWSLAKQLRVCSYHLGWDGLRQEPLGLLTNDIELGGRFAKRGSNKKDFVYSGGVSGIIGRCCVV